MYLRGLRRRGCRGEKGDGKQRGMGRKKARKKRVRGREERKGRDTAQIFWRRTAPAVE